MPSPTHNPRNDREAREHILKSREAQRLLELEDAQLAVDSQLKAMEARAVRLAQAKFDMAEAAEILNARLASLEAELGTLSFRLDVMVEAPRSPNEWLRFTRRDGKWQLELGETNALARAGAAIQTAVAQSPTAPEAKWRPVREVSLVKKTTAIALVPVLIEAMKIEYARRSSLFREASRNLDQLFELVAAERIAAPHLEPQPTRKGT